MAETRAPYDIPLSIRIREFPCPWCKDTVRVYEQTCIACGTFLPVRIADKTISVEIGALAYSLWAYFTYVPDGKFADWDELSAEERQGWFRLAAGWNQERQRADWNRGMQEKRIKGLELELLRRPWPVDEFGLKDCGGD